MNIKKISLTTVMLLLFLLPIASSYFPQAADELRAFSLHLSWQHDTATTMTMSWRTTAETDSIVQYGLNTTYTGEEGGDSGIWHHVELTGLTPATTYHYRVGNGITWSDDYSFTTGHHGSTTQFIGLGDSQGDTPECKWVADQVSRLPLDFMMFSGDFVEEAAEDDEYYIWFNNYAEIVRDTPTITTMGNHEKNHSNYYTMWALPGNEEYFSIDYGPVHLISLHTYYEGYELLGGDYVDQAAWLVEDLEANENATWTVVMMHRPPFSSFPRNFEDDDWYKEVNETFTPIFEQYEVDLVFTGHEHGYERLLSDNVTYIISGGAGSRLNTPLPSQELNESIYIESTYNFLYFDISDEKFHVRAFRPDYSFIDQFYINPETKPDLSFETMPLIFTQGSNDFLEMDIVITNTGEENITTTTTAAYTDLDAVQILSIPPLDVDETFTLSYTWSLGGFDQRTFSFELDYDSEVDEVSENNNELVITLLKTVEEETTTQTTTPTDENSFFAGLIGSLILLLSLMVPALAKRLKKD
ncbi:MAG: hypothetical protein GOP50_02365 [Candidatus Heimdallarchaeota archaeon]|nr:hypothetical protein [Candidatus Heimdallarchaeota archaeon]